MPLDKIVLSRQQMDERLSGIFEAPAAWCDPGAFGKLFTAATERGYMPMLFGSVSPAGCRFGAVVVKGGSPQPRVDSGHAQGALVEAILRAEGQWPE